MADRNRGEKSTVRIVRPSWEQNGYEQLQTLPVPVSSVTASRSPYGDAEEICKPGKSFKGPAKIFSGTYSWLVNAFLRRTFQSRARRSASFSRVASSSQFASSAWT